MRRFPAKDTHKNFAALSELMSDEQTAEDFTLKVDKPLGKPLFNYV